MLWIYFIVLIFFLPAIIMANKMWIEVMSEKIRNRKFLIYKTENMFEVCFYSAVMLSINFLYIILLLMVVAG